MKNDYLTLAYIIKAKRINEGYSLRAFARAVGISPAEVSKIENGIRLNHNLVILIRMCEVLDLNFIKMLKITNYLPSNYKEEDDNFFKNYEIKIEPETSQVEHDCKNCSNYCPVLNVCILQHTGGNQ